MLGDLFGDLERQQKELKVKLSSMIVEAKVAEGAIAVAASADRVIKNISIQPDLLDGIDAEELEDLLLTCINRALEAAAHKEQEETTKLLKENLPPGLGDLPGLF